MNIFYEIRDEKIYLQPTRQLTFPAHLHKELEIVYVFSGATEVSVDGTAFTLSNGDALVVFPNQTHSYRDLTEINALISIISPNDFPGFQTAYKNQIPISNKIPRTALEKIGFDQTARTILSDYAQSSPSVRLGYTTVFIGKLLDMCAFTDRQHHDSAAIRDVLTFCGENYKADITLEELSKQLGISKSYLSRLFSNSLNISFRDLINSLRIKDAMRMILDANLNVTEIAYAVGYTTVRSFNRAFLKWTGLSPRDYKKLLLQKAQTTDGMHILPPAGTAVSPTAPAPCPTPNAPASDPCAVPGSLSPDPCAVPGSFSPDPCAVPGSFSPDPCAVPGSLSPGPCAVPGGTAPSTGSTFPEDKKNFGYF